MASQVATAVSLAHTEDAVPKELLVVLGRKPGPAKFAGAFTSSGSDHCNCIGEALPPRV
jgi:hypothetical protein